MRLVLSAVLLLTAAALSPLTAQTDIRPTLLADLGRERAMTLAMVDSMPERLLRYHPVDGVRDFAQQIVHAALPVGAFAARARGETPPALGDSTQYLNSRAGLRSVVTRSYDYAVQALGQLSAADLIAVSTLADQSMPKWRMFALAHEHSVWTRGELVSYFRLNGMAPPAFQLFGGAGGE